MGVEACQGEPRPRDPEPRPEIGRDDPRFEEHLYQDTRRSLGTAAAVAGGVAVESRELKRTADRLDAALAPLIGALSGDPERR